MKVTALITPQGTVAITGLPLDKKRVASEHKISDDVNKLLQLSTKVKKEKEAAKAGAAGEKKEKTAAAKKKVSLQLSNCDCVCDCGCVWSSCLML